MAGKSPAFRFYPSDFMGSPDVQAMDLNEVGAYTLLLCVAWQQDRHGCLPDDENRIRRWARMTSEQWLCSRDVLLGKFPVLEPGIRGNTRMIAEAEKQREYSEAQSRKGSLGGRPKKPELISEKPELVLEKAVALEKEAGVKPSVSASVSVSVSAFSTSLCEDIYKAYPRKVGKQAALTAIRSAAKRLSRSGRSPAEAEGFLLERVRAYAQSRFVAESPPQFIPHPQKWFNQGRYDDDPQTWETPSGGSNGTGNQQVRGNPSRMEQLKERGQQNLKTAFTDLIRDHADGSAVELDSGELPEPGGDGRRFPLLDR